MAKKVFTITINSDDRLFDDAGDNVTDKLNKELRGDSEETHLYSYAQVRAALFQYVNDEIDALLENLEERFTDAYSKDTQRILRHLGDPEESKAELARLAHGDYLYDVMRGN